MVSSELQVGDEKGVLGVLDLSCPAGKTSRETCGAPTLGRQDWLRAIAHVTQCIDSPTSFERSASNSEIGEAHYSNENAPIPLIRAEIKLGVYTDLANERPDHFSTVHLVGRKSLVRKKQSDYPNRSRPIDDWVNAEEKQY
jgi:hypothetical protein